MVFSSIEFIFLFLPVFILIYYILPLNLRNAWLFAGSILFYTFGSWQNPGHIGLFLVAVIANYFFGRLVEKRPGKMVLAISVGVNLFYLGAFKYWLHILPVGISFYTFQAIAYLADIYRKKCSAEKSLIGFGTYLSMFPQLIAGPIVTYPSVRDQIYERKYEFSIFVQGLKIFVLGLGSKVLLANQVGKLWSQLGAIGYESISTPLAWLGIAAYTFQIYFDFLGYSLMAVGLGKMLGFALPANFEHPYLSVSMTEFWRRWHITLGSWFREYVYIPLGGNRCGKWKTLRNLFIVWLLTGIWHGASFNFALWGVLIFVLIAIEKAGFQKILEKYRVLGHLYMVTVIPFFWAVFAISDGADLIAFISRLLGVTVSDSVVFAGDFLKYGREYGLIMVICLLFIIRIPQRIWEKLRETYVGQLVLAGIFAGAVYCLYMGMDNPFLYYQF